MDKVRADYLVHMQSGCNSREKAKRLIMAGKVYMRGEKGEHLVSKPGQLLHADTELRLVRPERFVSRGGYKLETAIESFSLDFRERVVLDVGASTGGFTDCALQYGARRVYALDVGYGQLDYNLRLDERVVNLERVNIRHAPADLLPEKVGFLLLDCSFISLRTALPPALKFLRREADIVALVKPQFEVSRGNAPKGVVRCLQTIEQTVEGIADFAVRDLGLKFRGKVASSVLGPKGNQEYLMYCTYV